MSFNEKLQKLRKERKYSQEELADMLDVTRQSVSKWESGQTYPEMDKLLALCKIFNCSLEDLTNDEVKEISSDKKNNKPTVLDSILTFVEKTYKMFTNMKAIDIIKCIITMPIVALILLAFYLPVVLLQGAFGNMIFAIGNGTINTIIVRLFEIITGTAFIVLYVMIFIYIFKIAFLDKYVFIEQDKDEKKNIEVSEKIIRLKEKKDHDYPIFKTLGLIAMFFVKIFLVLFALPFFGIILILSATLVVSIYLLTQGIFFTSILLFVVFGLISSVLVLEFISNIVFNRQHNYKRMVITLLIGIIGLGISTGVFLLDLSSFTFHEDGKLNVTPVTEQKEVPFSEEMLFTDFETFDHEIDDSLEDVVIVKITYYEEFNQRFLNNFGNEFYIGQQSTWNNRGWIEQIKNMLRSREIYDLSARYNYSVVIRTSSENMTKIKINAQAYWDEHHHFMSQEERINELNGRIQELENKHWECEEKMQRLVDENN